MMKTQTVFVLAFTAASAVAQQATIISPANGSTITAGSQLVVDVHQDISPTQDNQIAVVLGLEACPDTSCTDIVPGDVGVGTILLKSLFDPQLDPSVPQEGLHQTFAVVVPEEQPTGPSILTLTHLQMVGAGNFATLATTGIVVDVA